MQTLKTLLLLALLASSDSYRQSRRYKGQSSKGEKEKDEVDNGKEEEKKDNDDKKEEEPRSYKGEKECEDVMDCVYKGVCMADGACRCLQNKCEAKVLDNCEKDKVCPWSIRFIAKTFIMKC